MSRCALLLAVLLVACSSTSTPPATTPVALEPYAVNTAPSNVYVSTQYDDRQVQPPEFRLCDPGQAGCPAFTRKVYDVTRTTAQAAAAPAPRVVTHRIFFALDSSTLDAEARESIDAMLASARRSPRIEVAGRTDPRGTRAHNERLARARAEAVRAALVRGGVAAERVGATAAEPCCDGPLPSTEADYAERRRATVTISITTAPAAGT